ncbi:MAG: transposase [Rhodoferax sp.]|nr:transposase [Rhodoferax sp.]
MARLARLTVPGLPHYVVQRGNNGQPIVGSADDHAFLLALIDENARKQQVAVHAYLVLPNQFELLLTPESADALPTLMQAVGRRYVRYVNDSLGRRGSLWEGRYRSTVLQAERHLLPCMALIDTSPLRAGLAAEPREYPWSSHAHYIGARSDRLITPHPLFWTLGNTPFAREAAYAEMVRTGFGAAEQAVLGDAVLRGWALGDEAFVANLQKQTERRVTKAAAGRPLSLKDQ